MRIWINLKCRLWWLILVPYPNIVFVLCVWIKLIKAFESTNQNYFEFEENLKHFYNYNILFLILKEVS